MSSEPMPGTRKICSVTMAPPKTLGICSATSVTTGISALRTTCLMIDDALGEALGARGGHVVEADHVEHGRAHVARPARALEQAEHAHRHDRLPELLPLPAPAGRGDVGAIDEGQPVELDAEQQDQQQAGEERRQREADEGQRAGDLVEPRIGPRRRRRCRPAGRSQRQRAATSRSRPASPAGAAGSACRRRRG